MGDTIDISLGSNRTWVVFVALVAASTALAAPAAAAATGADTSTATDGDDGGPTVRTSWYDVVNETTIVAAANLTDLGNASEASVRLEYRENGTDGSWTATEPRTVNTSDEFVSDLTGLEPSTEYEYRAVAETAAGTDRGESRLFETSYDRPEVTTGDAVEVSADGATLSATVTDLGDGDDVEVWFSYNPADSDAWTSEWEETDPQTVESMGTVTQTVTGLESDTEYDFRANVRNDRGYGYGGGTEQFATTAPFTVDTGPATNVSETNAVLTGNLGGLGGTDEATVWFEYSATGTDGVTKSEPIERTAAGDLAVRVTDLEPDTEYMYRIVRKTTAGDADNGTLESFATPSELAVETGSAADVTESGATLTGEVTDFGDSDAVTTRFEYRSIDADQWQTTEPVDPDSTARVETTVGGLEPGTGYEFRLVGETERGESDVGATQAFETAVDPVVETGSATAVGEELATVGMTLSDLGGADDATVAVEYRAVDGGTWTEAAAETLTEPGTLETTLSGLEPDTTYEYRAVAYAADETETGAVETLTTERTDHDPTVEVLSGSEDSSPNPHAELFVDWRVADTDSDLSSVTVTIENSDGQAISGSDERVAGTSASGSLDESVKHGAGDTYTVILEVEDGTGNVVTEQVEIDA
ncbi:fibronectin type III domain-containing protein [Natrinema sp. SYSU A 869]|uniref:fibronectin type III domain-containing protein n=1 Tax=Natrinema sp. SYSU A 869 TaxID=2871694 RepID=UPI001CA46B2E|nr:fibronectin type III domain-containing protein [Natrinema sp. SYSU A 869]